MIELRNKEITPCNFSQIERICTDAQPVLDPESVSRFCQVWAEVGRAILSRRAQASI